VIGKTDQFFSPDYRTARDRFRKLTERVGGRLQSLLLDAKGREGEDLSIDICWHGSEAPRSVVLHSSGIHGVEGFAGSAIQLQLLQDLPPVPKDSALIVVHILNPYGVEWLRRVNENNVDLNRNFLPGGSYRGAPPGYSKLDSFLNPQGPPSSDAFVMKALFLVLQYGMTSLKQAVAAGQYEYPKGLFFGGKQLQHGLAQYHSYLRSHASSAKSVLAIDVHTGLGKYGEDTLLATAEGAARLRPKFGERVRLMDPEQSPAYRIEGGLPSLLSDALPEARLDFIGQEFGTFNAIKVLHALREENRWHHYGTGGVDHPAKGALKQAFCPDDDAWRRAVLKRGREVLDQAWRLFE
jgi:hypothetical protein